MANPYKPPDDIESSVGPALNQVLGWLAVVGSAVLLPTILVLTHQIVDIPLIFHIAFFLVPVLLAFACLRDKSREAAGTLGAFLFMLIYLSLLLGPTALH